MFWKPITCMPVGAAFLFIAIPAFLFIAMKIKLISKYSSFPTFLIFFLTHSLQFIALFDGIHTANRLAPGIREHMHVRAVYEKSVISSGMQSPGMSYKSLKAYIIAVPSAEKSQNLSCQHYSHKNPGKARVQRLAIPSSHTCIFSSSLKQVQKM